MSGTVQANCYQIEVSQGKAKDAVGLLYGFAGSAFLRFPSHANPNPHQMLWIAADRLIEHAKTTLSTQSSPMQ